MQIYFINIIALLLLSWFSLPSYADAYEYIDEEGVIHFTDSPNHEQYVLVIKNDDLSSEVIKDLKIASVNSTTQINEDVNGVLPSQSELSELIAKSAKNNNLDDELIKAVIHVESSSKVNAMSPKGAQGLMQLMPATARRFGVTNSYDPAQNIEGGAKYLRELLNLFNNDISLALAAYNAGEQAVLRFGKRVPPFKETQAYVPKVINLYSTLLKRRATQ